METTAAISFLLRKDRLKTVRAKSRAAYAYESLLISGKKESRLHKIAFMYILGGFIGTLWETILNFVRGDGFVYCNGSLFTLFNPVYGFGAMLIVLALGSYKKPLAVLAVGTVMGGCVEALISLLEEAFLGTRSWDYAGDFLNIAGRTTVPLAVFFGVLCLLVVCFLYPAYNRFLSNFTVKTLKVLSLIVLSVILVDFACTATVLFRYMDRTRGEAPNNAIERFIDKHFDDTYMRMRFPQMKETEKQSVKNTDYSNAKKLIANTYATEAASTALNLVKSRLIKIDKTQKKAYTLLGSGINLEKKYGWANYIRA